MSEFTLEELRMIYAFTLLHYHEDILPLHEKLSSMINSYCEHVHDEVMYLSYPPQCKCKKCGEFYR